jgi:hypothetical protein
MECGGSKSFLVADFCSDCDELSGSDDEGYVSLYQMNNCEVLMNESVSWSCVVSHEYSVRKRLVLCEGT